MLGNKIFIKNFVKLSKNHVKHKGRVPFSLCSTESRNIGHQKICDCAFSKIKVFANRITFNQSLGENKQIQKCLSYVSDDICWNCKQILERKLFTCASCGALQYPRKDTNYFQILGVSQIYDVDLEELSQKFKNLQKIFHPDKFANKSEVELEISESYSRLINKAYSTLKDPLARGLYMLELFKVASESNFKIEPNFLMYIMEKNEELECLTSLSSVTKFMEENNENINKKILAISEAFRHSDLDSANTDLVKLNYFMNLDNKIKEKQSKFSTT